MFNEHDVEKTARSEIREVLIKVKIIVHKDTDLRRLLHEVRLPGNILEIERFVTVMGEE